jgi:hypothetical protein
MAIIKVIDNVSAEVDLAAATAFPVSSRAVITTEGFDNPDEVAVVYILGPSGNYTPLRNEHGTVTLGVKPNAVVLDGPASYKITKTETEAGAYVGYEE